MAAKAATHDKHRRDEWLDEIHSRFGWLEKTASLHSLTGAVGGRLRGHDGEDGSDLDTAGIRYRGSHQAYSIARSQRVIDMKTTQVHQLILPLLLAGLIAVGWWSTGVLAQAQSGLLEALKPGGQGTQAVSGRVSIPDKRSGNLIQPAGRDWRGEHEKTLPRVGMIAILGVLAALLVFYLFRGSVKIEGGRSGQTITRFKFIERFGHWLTAVSFLALGLTGLNLTFGKSLLLPLIGANAFSSLTQFGKHVHNYGSFAFTLGLVLLFLMWIKDNIPHPRDLVWFAKGGGILGFHVDAARFNGGQKVIFWAVILGGSGLAFTGYNMMFPFAYADIAGMQSLTILHGLIGVVLVAVIIAHAYIGTVGMEGAFEAMGTGEVDLNWAKSHHSLWVDQQQTKAAKSGRMVAAE
jgi:formate dehydrogenase subunit gamma